MIKQYFLTFLAASAVAIAAPLASAQDNSPSNQQSQSSQDMSGQDQNQNNGRGRHGAPDPAQRTAQLTQKLNLTSDQQTKVQNILQSQRSQMESSRQDNSSSQQDRRAKMMEIRKGTDSQIRAVLDSNQQKKWDEMVAQREQWGQNHRRGGPDADQQGPPPPQQ